MDAVQVLRNLIEENRTEALSYIEGITSGKPVNMEEYRRMCGVIHGLEIATEKVRHILNMIERGEDEDE